jgi:cysteine-rich repeat protein
VRRVSVALLLAAALAGCHGSTTVCEGEGCFAGLEENDLRSPRCGDGKAMGLESCDGADLRGASCATFGFNSGTLSCYRCVYDLRTCANAEICDNGVDDDRDGDKDCDDADCAVAPVCSTCGDGAVTAGEQCDDGARLPGDCCDAACQAEPGCEIEPNDDAATAGAIRGGGVRGWIRAADADDLFRLDIPEGTTGSVVATLVPALPGVSCIGGLDSLLQIVAADGTVLVADDDGGEGTCSRLTAAGIPPGAVLRVSRSPFDRAGADLHYQLGLSLETHACGDGVIDAGQECDDGNREDGDGCSRLCRTEPVVDLEPNDDLATATPAGGPLISGFISGAADRDVFVFELATFAELQLETGGDCAAVDTVLELLDAAGARLHVDDDGGDGRCASIRTAVLRPGLYYASVTAFGAGAYTLRVTELARCESGCEPEPVCGDGVVNRPEEECDDGGTVDGGCCSATCLAEDGCEREPNDDAPAAGTLLVTSVDGTIFTDGDVDVYAFSITATSDVRLEVSGGGEGCLDLDTYLTVLDGALAVAASDDDSGVGLCPRLTARLDAGRYRVVVRARHAAAAPPPVYRLSLSLDAACGDGRVDGREVCDGEPGCDHRCEGSAAASGCGNAVVEAGEACDDGNQLSGDGCAAACDAVEPGHIWEIADRLDANEPLTAPARIHAALDPIGDRDVFRFKNRTSSLNFLPISIYAPVEGECLGADTQLTVLDEAGNVLAFDDDGGLWPCSSVMPLLEPDQTVYVVVNDFLDDDRISPYVLVVETMCGDGIVDAGEMCDDGGRTPGDGCDWSCLIEPGHYFEDGLGDEAIALGGAVKIHGALPVGDAGDVFIIQSGAGLRQEVTFTVCSDDAWTTEERVVLSLRDAQGTELARAGPGRCAGLVQTLAPGETVQVHITESGQRVVPSYTLSVEPGLAGVCGNNRLEGDEVCEVYANPGCATGCQPVPGTCGNGIIDPGEACDGGVWHQWACSADCSVVTDGHAWVGGAPFGPITGDLVVHGRLSREAPVQVLTLANPGGATIKYETETMTSDALGAERCVSADTVLAVRAAGVEVARDDDSGEGLCSQLIYTLAPGGSAEVVVSEHAATATGTTYLLHVRGPAPPPVCGDGVLEPPEVCEPGLYWNCTTMCLVRLGCGNGVVEPERGEVCDDGNLQWGDACGGCFSHDPSHVTETHLEGASLSPGMTVHAAIEPAGNVDRFLVTNTGTEELLSFSTYDAWGGCRRDVDTVVRVFSTDGELLASDDDSGQERCSLARALVASGASVYVEVTAFEPEGVIAEYQLRVSP